MTGQSEPVQDVCRSLRRLVQSTLPQAVEGIYGGTKVGLALYSVGDGNKVVCGIQPSGDACLLYLHYLKPEDSPRMKLEGKGRHALHIRVNAVSAEIETELSSLLRLALSRSGAVPVAQQGAAPDGRDM